MEYTLSMTFITETGEKQTISISGVRENVTQSDAVTLMNTIVDNNIFITKKGALVAKHSAKLTTRQVTDFSI